MARFREGNQRCFTEMTWVDKARWKSRAEPRPRGQGRDVSGGVIGEKTLPGLSGGAKLGRDLLASRAG